MSRLSFKDMLLQISEDNPIIYPRFFITCDEKGIIQDIHTELLMILEYSRDELIGKFIGILMNPFMSFLHRFILLPMYAKMTPEEREASNYILESKLSMRPLIIYTKTKSPIYITISITYTISYFIVYILITKQTDNRYIYTSDINPPYKTAFVQSNLDMVIIGLDMKNSTEYLMDNGVDKTMALHNVFHTTMVELIRAEYYPYMYIHEIMGDGFIIVLNLEWSYHFPRFCASMAYAFIVKLYQRTKLTFRTGISYGKLHYGYIDNHLRFFGEYMNRASRYESACRDKMIATDRHFYQKLCDENMFQPRMDEEEILLKGIGVQEVIHLEYDYHAIDRMEELAIRSVENSPEMQRRPLILVDKKVL